MARIAIVGVPFYSHSAATVRLAGVLTGQGHEVRVWAPERWRSPIQTAGATFEPQAPEMPRGGGFALAADLAALTQRLAEPLIAQLFAWDAELLIRDSQAPWALVAADYLGLPRIVAYPIFPMAEADRPRPEDRAAHAPGPAPGSGIPDARARYEAAWRAIARRWGVEIQDLSGLFHSTGETTLVFTTELILGDRELPARWHCVGPLMPPLRPDTMPLRPLVYVSFGTVNKTFADLFRAVIAGLAAEPFDVLVSTGDGSVSGLDLEPLPPHVEVREFVSARDVLSRASVHITHAGLASVHESLLAGVPMLCLPQRLDQFPLAARIAELGAGLLIDPEPGSVRDGARRLLRSPAITSRAHALREHLEHYDGPRRVAEVTEKALLEAR